MADIEYYERHDVDREENVHCIADNENVRDYTFSDNDDGTANIIEIRMLDENKDVKNIEPKIGNVPLEIWDTLYSKTGLIQNDGKKIPMRLQKLTEEELEAYIDVNDRIKELTAYGVVKRTVPEGDWTFLSWSNGGEMWCVFHLNRLKSGDRTRVDANQLIVPYNKEMVYKFIPYLRDLPLYKNSVEAKQRYGSSVDDLVNWANAWLQNTDEVRKDV